MDLKVQQDELNGGNYKIQQVELGWILMYSKIS